MSCFSSLAILMLDFVFSTIFADFEGRIGASEIFEHQRNL